MTKRCVETGGNVNLVERDEVKKEERGFMGWIWLGDPYWANG
jgi:hypothetical protein